MIRNSETTRIANSTASGKRKLTTEQLMAIRKGAAASGGLLALVAGGYAAIQASASRNAEEAVLSETDTQEEVCEEVVKPLIHSTAPIAASVADEMSFGEAFEAARGEVGPGGLFVWRGQPYHTYSAEEWSLMEESDQLAYLNSMESGLEAEEVAQVGEEAPELASAGSEALAGSGNGSAAVAVSAEEELIELTPLSMDDSGQIDGVGIDFGADGVVEAILIEGNDDAPDSWIIDADGDGAIELQVLTDTEGNILASQAIDPPLPTSAYIEQHQAGDSIIMTESELNARLSTSPDGVNHFTANQAPAFEDNPDDVVGPDYEEDADVSDMSV